VFGAAVEQDIGADTEGRAEGADDVCDQRAGAIDRSFILAVGRAGIVSVQSVDGAGWKQPCDREFLYAMVAPNIRRAWSVQ
jgi:hypothetical protein